MSHSIPVISYPAGKCPVKLKGTSHDEVIGWAEEIFCIGRNNNIIYLPSAIAFFAQQFYRIGTNEYKIVCDCLIEQYGSINYYEEEIYKLQNKPVVVLSDNIQSDKPKRRGRKSRAEKERLEKIEKINLEIKINREKKEKELQEAKEKEKELENKKPEKKTIKIKKKL